MNDVLSDLATALNNDDEATVIDLSETVASTVQKRKQQHHALQNLALEARKQTNGDSPIQSTATELINQATVAAQAHAELGLKVSGYLHGEISGSEASSLAQTASDAHANFEQKVETVQASTTVSVGPMVAILGTSSVTIPKGATQNVKYTVENIGDGPTTDVEVEVRSPLSLTAEPVSIESIEPEQTKPITLTGTANKSGNHTGAIRVRGESVIDDLTVQFTVQSKMDYLQTAANSLRGLQDILDDTNSDDTSGGRDNKTSKKSGGMSGLSHKVKTAHTQLQQLIQRLEQDTANNKNSIDNKTEAVVNLLGAILNHVEAQDGKSLSPSETARIRVTATKIIDTLSKSQQAQI